MTVRRSGRTLPACRRPRTPTLQPIPSTPLSSFPLCWAEAAAPSLELHVLLVPCWGAFVPALNALLDFAQGKGMTHILYQSLEMQCTPVILQKFLDHFNSNVLLVGPVLPGHTFASGQQTLNGRTTPWNTLALWSVRKLALTGFLCIADGMARSSQHDQVSPNRSGTRAAQEQRVVVER